MLKRIITGLCFIGFIVGFFFLRKIDRAFFELFAFIFLILGCLEMLNALKDKISLPQKIAVLVFALALVPLYHYFKTQGVMYLFIGAALVLLLLMVVFNDSLEGLSYAALTMFYPCLLLLSFLYLNDLPQNSTLALVMVFTISPCADTLAYAVGITFKGKKLCPNISPNKTISGAVGGLIGGVLGALVLYFIFKDSIIYGGGFPLAALIILVGLAAAFLTEAGDLVESIIKRRIGIKDMGKILPGHGGVLDRIDGIIFCSWFIYAVFSII